MKSQLSYLHYSNFHITLMLPSAQSQNWFNWKTGVNHNIFAGHLWTSLQAQSLHVITQDHTPKATLTVVQHLVTSAELEAYGSPRGGQCSGAQFNKENWWKRSMCSFLYFTCTKPSWVYQKGLLTLSNTSSLLLFLTLKKTAQCISEAVSFSYLLFPSIC